jgi:hypothetical protein
MNRIITLLLLVSVLIFTSCNNRSGSGSEDAYAHQKAEVKEVIQTTSYTYLKVDKNDEEMWIAITRQDIKEDQIIYFEGGLEMNNFESPELNRTFESVFFVDRISDQPITQDMPHGMGMDQGQNQPMKPVIDRLDIRISQPEGGTAIGILYLDRNGYAGQNVIVRGQVTKVNAGIMGRNWVHIQDGSSSDDYYDLTVTTDHLPQMGDTVTYSGTLSLDKDFGAGYFYEVILEDAEAIDAKPMI